MKRFSLILAALLGCGAPQTARAAIDAQARLSIGDALIYEGNSRYRELAFPVSLPAALPYDVSASYQIKPISAAPVEDYTPQSAGQIVIKAGQTSANIIVRVTGDAVEERDEKFLVQLNRPKRATLADGDGIGTIRDDDYSGQVSISDTSVAEVNAGQKLAKVDVTLSSAPLHEIEVRYEARDGSAISRQDYLPTRGSLFFQPGRRVLSIAVPILSDRTPESDEKLFVSIVASPYNPVLDIVKNLGVLTIRNDDKTSPAATPIELSITDSTRSEENGDLLPLLFSVTLAQPAPRPLEISYQTQDRTATAPGDYTPTSGVLRFAAGETMGFISVPMVSDTVEERNETFALVLSAPEGLSGDTEATGNIHDDDYNGRISISGVELSGAPGFVETLEGDSGLKNVRVLVTLSPAPLHSQGLVFQTNETSSAVEGIDFIAKSEVFFVAPENPQQIVEVAIVGDTEFEPEESFAFYLSKLTAPTFEDRLGIGVIRIRNDDAVPGAGSGKIAFESTRDGNREIYVMNADGTNQTRLTNNTAWDLSPGLSPDGSKIAFISDRDGANALWVMGADGSAPRKIYSASGVSCYHPRFSPQGDKIALVTAPGNFFSPGTTPSHVMVINTDGSGACNISSQVLPKQIAWSPDGSQIAFTLLTPSSTSPAVSYRIARVNVASGAITPLTSGSEVALDPSFSPDGSKIAFSMRVDERGGYLIHVMNPDGTNVTRLAPLRASDLDTPNYSPDGKQIVFSLSFGERGLGLMNADGSDQKFTVARSYNPSWSVGSVPAPVTTQAAEKPSAGHS